MCGKKASNLRKRKSFSAQEKLYALDQLKKGKQQIQLARELGIKEKLCSLPSILEEETGLQSKKVKFPNDKSLDSALYQWFVQAHSERVPISGPILKAQAEKFDHLINGNESKSKASDSWLDRFKKRHTISQVLVSEEIHSADKKAADSYPIELKKLLEEGCNTADQVYSCDETGLFTNEKALSRGRTKSLLFCIKKSGSHKVRPLMIRKVRSPRCFHHVNMQALPFEYTNSKNAWMNSSMFEGWFHKTFMPAARAHLRKLKQEEKALLLLDNCSAHSTAENLVSHDSKIKVSYLPKNTTSEIQPLDKGIISAFKQNYRREMIGQMVVDNNSSFDTSLPEFTRFIDDDVCLAEEALREYEHSHHDILNWFSADDICPIYEHISDDENVANVSRKNETAPLETETSGTNDNDGTRTPPPKVSEAVKHLEVSLRWLETQDVYSIKILQLRSILYFARSQQSVANNAQQNT
uniref:HTH CENPB-type domain-containing protein n=1 Tax=Gopherus agassizii TaxID=38772 RepID=A0A452ICV0_9SAUR